MSHQFAEIMFTEGVRTAQQAYGSRERLQRFSDIAGPNDALGQQEATFIAQRDSFYMATVNEQGWPYVQHRGGAPGFLRILGPQRLGYADFRGNTQLISVGNLSSNDRVSLILMDYPNRRRLKIMGRMRAQSATSATAGDLAALQDPSYGAKIERLIFLDIAAFDWNCPQHISPRFTEAEWANLQTNTHGDHQ